MPKVFSLASLEKAGYEPVLSDPPKLLLAAVEKKANFKKKKEGPLNIQKVQYQKLQSTIYWALAMCQTLF